MTKFKGSWDDLKLAVAQAGGRGEWKDLGNEKRFDSEDGAVVSWWESTKTLRIQGNPAAAARLKSGMGGGAGKPKSNPAPPQSKVFIVHGHDETALEQLELVLRRLDLQPFVLKDSGGDGLTIIEALEQEILQDLPAFGIVLLTPDDMGYAKAHGEDKIEPRARQNVVLEMGMLIGRLGRKRVAILKKGHLEVPSDASGIIYVPFNDHVKETVPKLTKRLMKAGFELTSEQISAAAP